jgi:hypothetical protein
MANRILLPVRDIIVEPGSEVEIVLLTNMFKLSEEDAECILMLKQINEGMYLNSLPKNSYDLGIVQ